MPGDAMTNETGHPDLPLHGDATDGVSGVCGYSGPQMYAYLDTDRAQRATADEALLRQALKGLSVATGCNPANTAILQQSFEAIRVRLAQNSHPTTKVP
jgi:hypothetical protein